ncbi:hypothetical protein N657DRAFT_682569 [Parathielavia appendiculata]|uniref:Uncharacterized protein n=1 Tax=Parathielavia appendiculata TaxID=2587402 RepID=A0AAN6Z1F6_9PEZI|nr:hypothetical protein N657DRAFT_682569 [Parathielavia appendiculata]
MLRHLSSFPSCTVLRLSGQFCIPVDFFDSLSAVANPFPALNVFHLDIGPDTSDGKWFFVKDETKLAWEKARQGPERANYVQCTEDGIFPSNPSHPTSPAGMTTATGHTWRPSYDEFAYLEEKDLLRSWTLPDDETVNPMLRGATGAMGRGPKIEQFTVRLSDNFDNVVCDVNCVW